MSYVVVARWRASAGARETIEKILRELVRACQKEPGCLEFIAHRSQDDSDEFLLYERYTTEQAFRDHQQTEHFKMLVLDQAVPLLAARERHVFHELE